MAGWERGWGVLFGAISPLSDGDLGRVVLIRKEPHTVFEAINRQTAHYGEGVVRGGAFPAKRGYGPERGRTGFSGIFAESLHFGKIPIG